MSLFNYAVQNSTPQPTTTMKQFESSLCTSYKDDPYKCIDCEKACDKGKQAVEKLEKDTRKSLKLVGPLKSKIAAMSNYVEAASQTDPIKFVMDKYGVETVKAAKQKVYLWQHAYGTNLRMVSEKIQLLNRELADLTTDMKNESSEPEKPVIDDKLQKNPLEEKKMTKRQEEKISQSRLEQMRTELEEEYLKKEADIKSYQKEIENCEKRMTEITEEITSIRRVLEIFKKKDALYV